MWASRRSNRKVMKGRREVTSRIVKENGKQIEEEVLEEELS